MCVSPGPVEGRAHSRTKMFYLCRKIWPRIGFGHNNNFLPLRKQKRLYLTQNFQSEIILVKCCKEVNVFTNSIFSNFSC